jgi:hypothetical protein
MKNPHAVALGLLGASLGGKRRAATLTPGRRQEIARKASQARWARHRRAEGLSETAMLKVAVKQIMEEES